MTHTHLFDHATAGVEHNVRCDGREQLDFRAFSVQTGVRSADAAPSHEEGPTIHAVLARWLPVRTDLQGCGWIKRK
jgi:hypothetical protein